jgi:L-serine dehydratase
MMKNELALHSKEELEQHFANVWEVMRGGIERGITTEGVLPGKLRVPRRAAALRRMLVSTDKTTTDPMAVVDWINMFALAVNEENAAGAAWSPRRPTVPAVSFRRCWRTTTSLSVK